MKAPAARNVNSQKSENKQPAPEERNINSKRQDTEWKTVFLSDALVFSWERRLVRLWSDRLIGFYGKADRCPACSVFETIIKDGKNNEDKRPLSHAEARRARS